MDLEAVREAAEKGRSAHEELVSAVLEAYAERWSPTKIAEAAGITKATVHRWVRDAASKEGGS